MDYGLLGHKEPKYSTLKTEAIGSSETLVITYNTERRCKSEYHNQKIKICAQNLFAFVTIRAVADARPRLYVSRLDINLMKRAELTLIYLNLSLVWLWTT
jgi:hypothetical protein